MKTRIETVTRTDIARLISSTITDKMTEQESRNLASCTNSTTTVWVGYIDEELVCIWGLVPPTLLSNVAYLWLHTTDKVRDHEFIFVRRSQQAIKKILEIYPEIVGHCEKGSDRSIRWLKWLGAVFGEPDGKLVPFAIRAA